VTMSLLPAAGVIVQAHAPAELLRAHVETYWELRVDAPPATINVVPDGLVDLIFDLKRSDVFVGGTNLEPAAYTHQHAAHLLGASLKPGTALQLLGVGAGSLKPDWQRLEDVIGPAAKALAGLVFGAETVRDRFALIDAFLLARLFATNTEPRVQQAVAAIIAHDGAVDVDALGKSSGASPRNLGRMFDDWVGMPPKRFARIIRLQSALRRLQEDPGLDLTQLALDCGYADHAHLTREMQALAGISPSAFKNLSDSFKR
jgi:AraC-like DNA-binding protein